jgi:hypothetical protein
MALLPTLKKIQRADLGGDVPLWIEGILSYINQFTEEIYSAMNRNITIPENVKGQIKVLEFRTGGQYISQQDFTEQTFLNSLGKRMQVLFIGNIVNESKPDYKYENSTVSWNDNGNGTVTVRYISGLEDNQNYRITLLGF